MANSMDIKIHRIDQYRPDYQPAYLANGLVGLRVGPNPLLGGVAFINGFVGLYERFSIESYAPAPYPLGGDIILDGRSGGFLDGPSLAIRPDLAVFREQAYDFACGELTAKFTLSIDGKTARIEVLTFCSRSLPTLALQEVKVEVDQTCRLVLRAVMDPAGLPGRSLRRIMPEAGADAILHWEGRAGLSTCGAGFFTQYVGDELVEVKRNDWGDEANLQYKEYLIDAVPGKTYKLRQYGCLVPSIMNGEPHWQALRLLKVAAFQGFDRIRTDNRTAWAELWRGRVKILGAEERWQDLADAAFFYLHSSIHPSTPCSMAPYGLGQYHHYHGHVFWDTESFMYPPILLTAPESAQAILDYRTRLLPAARANAGLSGYRGLQFPWQSGNHGWEHTPVGAGGAAGLLEQHVNMDVAHAFAQHAHATGDEEFLREQAWPVLKGVAEWIASRVVKTTRGYEIRNVTGPDEGADNVHNDSYTNVAAIMVLREAIGFARRLGLSHPTVWGEIERGMFLQRDSLSGALFNGEGEADWVCEVETLMAFFPYNFSLGAQADLATYRQGLVEAEKYMGNPMMAPFLGVFAARVGDRKLARDLYEAGNFQYLVEPFMQFVELGASRRPTGDIPLTPFITQPGALLMGLLLGLPGLQIGPGSPEEWCRLPVVMPEGWEGIEVERIWVRGRPALLSAMQGGLARIEIF